MTVLAEWNGSTVEVEVADTGDGLTGQEAHGGRIWFRDSARGACVRFSLPRGS